MNKRKPEKEDTRTKLFLIGVLIFMVVFLIVLFAVIARAEDEVISEEQAQTEEGWDQWGVGDDLFAVGEPWDVECKKKCFSLKGGVDKGRGWCADGCGYYHRKHSYRIYAKYMPWLVLWAGGVPGIWIAQTCRTESEGETDSVTHSLHKEVGLCSVNRVWAKQLNINSCDPKANLWASSWMRNNRLIEFRGKHPNIKTADLDQQWYVAGAAGAVGGGKVIGLLKKCGIKKGKNQYDALGNCLLSWHRKWVKSTTTQHWISKLGLEPGLLKGGVIKKKKHKDDPDVADPKRWKNLEKYQDLYNGSKVEFQKVFKTTFGHKPGLVALRCTRHEGVEAQIVPLYEGGELPWGEPVLPPRPDDIDEYPGDVLHGKCWHWPQYKNRVPTQEEWDAMDRPEKDARDPATLKIIKGYKGKLIGKVKDVTPNS